MNQYVTRTIIKELRERNKMTQLQLADKLGVTDERERSGRRIPWRRSCRYPARPSPAGSGEFPIVKDTASDITTPRLYNIKSTPKLLISKIGACFHI